MPKAPLYNTNGEALGECELPESIFAAPADAALLHQAVVAYLANQRQGTASTKTRGMVSGGGRKPWRQKGTGRARQGSIRAPHWRGGGIVFGPHPRDYRQALPKKARRAALRGALTEKAAGEAVCVLDELQMAEAKTKGFAAMLDRLPLPDRRTLVVTAAPERNVWLSGRNIPDVVVRAAADLNAYEVLKCKTLVMTRAAVDRVEEVFGA
ncbi:MAG TPA: 50S ribosomal protein L4 [Bacillota bacterium]|nr:50S ribosomal protein L4 [Bacillota bacterium]